MKKLSFILLFVFGFSLTAAAQPAQKYVRVEVAPQHEDWLYRQGEKARFDVTVLKNDIPLKDVAVRWELSEDTMEPFKSGLALLKDGRLTIDAGTMSKPGFLRCRVKVSYDGREYEGLATAGFDPGQIAPTQKDPADFDDFWDAALADNSLVPMSSVTTLIPEKCTSTVDVYHVSFQNYRYGARMYGVLSVPKAEGKYPAVLVVPGAGIRPYPGNPSNADRGMIVLEVGIHGIPVDLPAGVYNDLSAGALSDYMYIKLDDRDNYYYKRVYLGCARAVDYLASMPQFDGRNICVEGGSQGGALAIITAALNPKVTCLASIYPALCDLTGYLHGRAGGWPHMFRNGSAATRERIETTAYYDVVNFARRVRVPGYYSLGYNDVTCPPTSMFAAYNSIEAPKELFVIEELGHFMYPEQWARIWNWIDGRLKVN